MPFATGSGVRIHYEVEGSGPPLVVHAGFMGSIPDWSDAGYVNALKGENTLVLLDPRGQGASEKPHETAAYVPEQRVSDVLAVMDALGVARADFLGYSMGGRVGFDLGVRAPERFFSLILGGASPFGGMPDPAGAELYRRGIDAVIADYERQMGPLPENRRARWRATVDPEAIAAVRMVERPSLEAALGTMRLPVLLYCGDQDPAYEHARRAAALLPDAAMVTIPRLTHREVMFQSAASLPHIRAFLQRVRSGVPAPAAPA